MGGEGATPYEVLLHAAMVGDATQVGRGRPTGSRLQGLARSLAPGMSTRDYRQVIDAYAGHVSDGHFIDEITIGPIVLQSIAGLVHQREGVHVRPGDRAGNWRRIQPGDATYGELAAAAAAAEIREA
jgi:hypothetical protein